MNHAAPLPADYTPENSMSLSEARMRLGELVEKKLPKTGVVWLTKYNLPVAKIVPADETETRRKRMMNRLENRRPIFSEKEGNAPIKRIYRLRNLDIGKKPVKIWD